MKTEGADRRPTARELIDHFKMQRIPHEGAWYAMAFLSPDPAPAPHRLCPRGPSLAEAPSDGSGRRAYSAIYALETQTDFSALHRLAVDEMWHYYGGAALELLLLHPDGRGETIVLGPDILAGEQPQFRVARGVWQGSRPLSDDPDAYSFFGTTVVPGFEYSDYEPGLRGPLQALYPGFAEQIARLTRE